MCLNSSGFDVVIGNPPYGAELTSKDRKYLKSKFKLRNTNTACLFMKSASTHLLNENGINSFIVPKSFIYSSTWKEIRDHLLEDVKEIVDCGKVWKKVMLEQVMYISQKNKKTNCYRSCIRENQKISFLTNIDKETLEKFGCYLNGISSEELMVGRKVHDIGAFLNDYIVNQRGALCQKHIQDQKSSYKVLGGKQLSRYYIGQDIKGYMPEKHTDDEKMFIKKDSILVQRIVAHIRKPFSCTQIKGLLSRTLNIQENVIVDTINQLQNISNLNSEFLLAIVNSKLMSWYVYRFIFVKATITMQFDNPVTSRMPCPKIDLSNTNHKSKHDRMVSLVNQMSDVQKELHAKVVDEKPLQQKSVALDHQIDALTYKLYNLTEKEIEIVEGKSEPNKGEHNE